MTKKLNELDFDLGDTPNPIIKLDSLDSFSNFNLETVGTDVGTEFLPSINARYGVLHKVQLKCGARTRKGTPCQCKPIPRKRRCKFHGGASTGPKTFEGKQKIADAQRLRWALWRQS